MKFEEIPSEKLCRPITGQQHYEYLPKEKWQHVGVYSVDSFTWECEDTMSAPFTIAQPPPSRLEIATRIFCSDKSGPSEVPYYTIDRALELADELIKKDREMP